VKPSKGYARMGKPSLIKRGPVQLRIHESCKEPDDAYLGLSAPSADVLCARCGKPFVRVVAIMVQVPPSLPARRVRLEAPKAAGGRWVASIPGVPGAYSQGHTEAEARAMLNDALNMIGGA
jgi:hypothetical protein